MLKRILTAGLLALSGTALAQPESHCITNELERDNLTAALALEIGNCHLAAATRDANDLAALQYAHSWFLQARELGAKEAQHQLDTTDQRLQLASKAQ